MRPSLSLARRAALGAGAGDDPAALFLALVTENAELHQQLADAPDMLMETAIYAGHLHARIEAVQDERDGWMAEVERSNARTCG